MIDKHLQTTLLSLVVVEKNDQLHYTWRSPPTFSGLQVNIFPKRLHGNRTEPAGSQGTCDTSHAGRLYKQDQAESNGGRFLMLSPLSTPCPQMPQFVPQIRSGPLVPRFLKPKARGAITSQSSCTYHQFLVRASWIPEPQESRVTSGFWSSIGSRAPRAL